MIILMGHFQDHKAGILAALLLGLLSVQGVTIQKASREITLATQIVRVVQKFEVVNDGKSPATEFLFCSSEDQAAHLAFEEVFFGEDDDPSKVITADVKGVPVNVSCFAAQLSSPVAPGKTFKVEIQSVYTELQKPWPAAIQQSDPQRVLYFDNLYILSPYTVESQSTKVKLPSKTVESYTKVQPVVFSGTTLKYGPYSNVAPFKVLRLRLHFDQNTPFATVVSLLKEVEVSHWGNVYVEEIYELKHGGALHKGVWSRLDFMSNARVFGQAAFNEIVAVLPAGAHSLYYKDEIGNISTSNVRYKFDKVEAYLRPRFPLFGGWSTKFTFGYSLPLESVVTKTKDGALRLATSFSTPLRGVYVTDLTVKVVLPEGSNIVATDVPFAVEESFGKKYTYLDTAGRPVLYLRKSNVVEEHNQEFTVKYTFNFLHLLQEPLLLVGGFLTFFATIILYQRSDFTISISRDKTRRAKELKTLSFFAFKAAAVLQATTALQSASASLAELEKAVSKLEGVAKGGASEGRSGAEQAVKATADKVKEALGEVERVLGPRANVADIVSRLASLQTAALALGRGGREAKPLADLKKELYDALGQLAAPYQVPI